MEIHTATGETMDRRWPQLRKFLVFQIKLYIDVFRDIFLSFLSFGAFIIDLIQMNTGADSYFEQVLKFGYGTGRAINLFNQYGAEDQGPQSVDKVLRKMEDKIRSRKK